MELPKNITWTDPLAGDRVAVVGDVYRMLATGKETGGKYALVEATVPPGGGPPPHVHSREEEGFYVLAGEVTFLVGDQSLTAGPGQFVNLPIGCWHSFQNRTDQPAKMLILLAPAGLEQMFLEVGVPMTSEQADPPQPTPEDIAKLVAAAPRYGVELRLSKE